MTKHWLNTTVSPMDLNKARCELRNCFLLIFKHFNHIDFFSSGKKKLAFASSWGLKTVEITEFFFFSCNNDWLSLSTPPLPPPRESTLNSYTLSNHFSQVFLLFRQMPSLTLLGLLYRDNKHTAEVLTHSFVPNKWSLLARQIKELTSAAFCNAKNNKALFQSNNRTRRPLLTLN